MILLPEEKDVERKLYQHEVDELAEYAISQGLSKKEAEVFVKNSVGNLMKGIYQGILSKEELDELVSEKIAELSLEL